MRSWDLLNTLLWLQQIRTSYLPVSCNFKMIEWKRVLYCSWFRLWMHSKYKNWKRKLMVIKMSKITFSGLKVLLTVLWDLIKDILQYMLQCFGTILPLFGLKSYLWFQIELALCTRPLLKSRAWFQYKLQSTQFNYHYALYKLLMHSSSYLLFFSSVSLTSKQSSYRGCSRHSNCYYNSSDRRRHLLLEKKKQTRCTNSGCAQCHHHNNYDHYSVTPCWIPSRDYTSAPTPWYTPYSSPTP